jgi:hypothetical protein
MKIHTTGQEDPKLTATAQALAKILGDDAILPPVSFSQFSKSRLSSLNYYPALSLEPKFEDPYSAYDDFDSAAFTQIDAADVARNDLKNPAGFSYDNTTYKSLEDDITASLDDSLERALAPSSDNEPIKPVPAANEEPQSFVQSEIKKIEAREMVNKYRDAFKDIRTSGQASKAAPESPKSVRDAHNDDSPKHDKDDGGGFKP